MSGWTPSRRFGSAGGAENSDARIKILQEARKKYPVSAQRRHIRIQTIDLVHIWTGDVGVVEPFASLLQKAGKQYFNHGGLLRVNSDEDDQTYELKVGDGLIVEQNGRVRVYLPTEKGEAP